MAALPYIQLYTADYLSDTAHLSTIEHGAYLLLIFNYWQRGESFKAKDEQTLNKRLASVARLSENEWENVKENVLEYFEIAITNNGVALTHKRLDTDLNAVIEKSNKASQAGKASAASRGNKRSTDVKQTLNHTDTDTDTDTEKPKNKTSAQRFDAQAHLEGLGVPPNIARLWRDIRKNKRAIVTEEAIKRIAEQAMSINMSLADALKECVDHNWAGFKPEWLENRAKILLRASPSVDRQLELERRNAEVAANWLPPELRGLTPEEFANATAGV